MILFCRHSPCSWCVTHVSLVSPGQREGEIDKRLHLSRDVLTAHTLYLILQLTLECPRDNGLSSWRGVVTSQVLVNVVQ